MPNARVYREERGPFAEKCLTLPNPLFGVTTTMNHEDQQFLINLAQQAGELAHSHADKLQIEGKAELFTDFEDRHTLFDSLILCRFFRDLYPWERLAVLIKATTGMELDKKQLQKMALGITNKAREFNLREGMTAAADTLPERFFKEKLEDSGKVLLKSDFDKMLSDYYKIKGWD